MIPAGTYVATVAAHAMAMTSTGKEQVAVGFTVEFGDGSRRSITWYGYFTDITWERTCESLGHLGWNAAERGYKFDELNGTEILVGQQAEIVVETEQSNQVDDRGDPVVRSKVRWVNRLGGALGIKERMSDADAAQASQTLRQRILAWKGPGQPTRAQPARPAARAPAPARRPAPQRAGPAPGTQAGIDFDDIPF